jgi:putative ABC transport system permease protein
MVEKANPVLFGIVSSADHPIITCFGVTGDDARIREATWIAGSRNDFGIHPDAVALGERAAEFLHASVGTHVEIGHGTFQVMGVIRTRNGFEDGTSSVLLVKLRNRNDQAAFKAQVKQQYPSLIALEDEEFNRSYSQFKILKATAWAVGACGVLLGGLGVANTMIMSVFTRIREIAILRVNGFSNIQIASLIFGESGAVSLVGAAAGLVIGAGAIIALKLIPALHGYVDAEIEPVVVIAVVLLACSTGAAGALYPAFYAMRVRAVEALRFE